MKIDLHMHTRNSCCGNLYSEEVLMLAKKNGIKCIAITDHNKVTIIKGNKHGIIVIPATEISTKRGHIIGLNIKKPIKIGLSVDETIKEIKKQKGIVIIPHPFDLFRKGIFPKAKKGILFETVNGRSSNRINHLAKGFCKKHKLKTIGGSDAHFRDEIGCVYSEIKDCKTKEEVLNILKRGRIKIVEKKRSQIKPHIRTIVHRITKK